MAEDRKTDGRTDRRRNWKDLKDGRTTTDQYPSIFARHPCKEVSEHRLESESSVDEAFQTDPHFPCESPI